MSLTTFTQSTVWAASDFGVDIAADYATGNVSGLGSGQYVAFTNAGAIAVVGRIYAITIQAPIPPPIWYFSTTNAGDTFTIQTPVGTLVDTETFTPGVGFNGQYFQPAAGGTYVIYYKASIATVVGGVFFNLQSVIQNTLGQYINLATVSFGKSNEELKQLGSQPPLIGTTIALNTTSAVPNTLTIDFSNYPMNRNLNTLANIRVLVTTSAILSWGNDFLASVGAATETVLLTAGSWFPVNYFSPKVARFNGRVSLTIQNVGQTIVPATTLNYAVANMFPQMMSNQPALMTEAQEVASDVNSDLAQAISQLKTMSIQDPSRVVNSRIDGIEDRLDAFEKRNTEAHARLYESIASVLHMLKYPIRESRRESTIAEVVEEQDNQSELDLYLKGKTRG